MALKIAGNTVVDDNLKAYVDGVDLSAISASIADTAVDVFVYDTRKDSDGGAWRKRTQHTSWYNETLNTATRGSRKEFPAVAVIVVEAGQMTIYDGDDPDLPMWMVFNSGQTDAFMRTSTINATTALNGQFVYCGSFDTYIVDFIRDDWRMYDTGYIWKSKTSEAISQRNDTSGIYIWKTGGIVNRTCNDIAMTVLPNAPIDPATQLPIPTIAVATNGGVSVIKDDGSVVDITFTGGGNAIQDVTLVEDMLYVAQPNSGTFGTVSFGKIPSSDVDLNVWRDVAGTSDNYQLYRTLDPNIPSDDITCISENAKAFGFTQGLVTTDIPTNPSFRKGMTSLITSTYNTGWMNGDIKLATLSDTDATDVTGTELVTNGTFDTDVSGWTANTTLGSTTTFSWNSGVMQVSRGLNGLGYGEPYQVLNTVVGTTYTLTATVTTSTMSLGVGNSLGTSGVVGKNLTVGTHAVTFTAQSTTTYITFTPDIGNTTSNVDNISVRLAEEDRSVNGNGLQVFGTVTKSAVNTGADLVAYSGFSGSNYLHQPYNSALDVGTGDLCAMIWFKSDGADAYSTFFARGTIGDQGYADMETGTWFFQYNHSTKLATVYHNDGGSTSIGWTNTQIPHNTWAHLCFVRRSGGKTELWINGKLDVTGTWTANITPESTPEYYKVRLGYMGSSYTYTSDGDELALARISATAPTAEQIKTIYESEKHLFTEGAKCTLTGTSDAVTALAYDSDTDLLHVGSSSGRSVFSGLRRVDETATAVTTSISASNGMVVEQ